MKVMPSLLIRMKQFPDPADGSPLFGFLVDTDRCIGAGKCLTACRTENNVPERQVRTWVERYIHYKDGTIQVDTVPETGYSGSNLPIIDREEVERSYFVPKLCNQCARCTVQPGLPDARIDHFARGDRTRRSRALHWLRLLCTGLPLWNSFYESGHSKRGQVRLVLPPNHARRDTGVCRVLSDGGAGLWPTGRSE